MSEAQEQPAFVSGVDGRLTLRMGRSVQGMVDPDLPHRLVLVYQVRLAAALYLHPELSRPGLRILSVGLGAGNLPRFISRHFPNVAQWVVEQDRQVISLVQDRFPLAPDVRLVEGEGRAYIEAVDECFDLILLDAYDTHYIPYRLRTLQFLQAVRQRLGPDGLVLSNTWSSSPTAKREVRTFAEVFGRVVQVGGPGAANRVLVAGPGLPAEAALGALRNQGQEQADRLGPPGLGSFLVGLGGVEGSDGPVLRDGDAHCE